MNNCHEPIGRVAQNTLGIGIGPRRAAGLAAFRDASWARSAQAQGGARVG